VLKVVVYTGFYYQTDKDDTKKTVQVVKELCKAYAGSYRTVYVDRFYTSLDLLKALDKMSLYVTGKVMKNILPKE
jgi:Transposase IS4